jgi:hypothetical protein
MKDKFQPSGEQQNELFVGRWTEEAGHHLRLLHDTFPFTLFQNGKWVQIEKISWYMKVQNLAQTAHQNYGKWGKVHYFLGQIS